MAPAILRERLLFLWRTSLRILAAMGALPFMGLFLEVQEAMPNGAWLVVDEKRREYFSPPCMTMASLEQLAEFETPPKNKLAREVRAGDYRPNDWCREQSGFSGNSWSLTRRCWCHSGVPIAPRVSMA